MDNSPNETITDERTRVGFPETPREEKKKFNVKAFLVFLILLLLLGGGAWFLFGRTGMELTEEEEISVTPTPEVVEETPTPTPAETIDKKTLKVQILNGSGVPGAAGKLQDIMESLGYEEFDLGNASNYTYKSTEVSFDSKIPQSARQEIMTELEKTYATVEESEVAPGSYDIKIIAGYTKGMSPTVTQKPKASVSVSPSPTTRVTTSVSPTKTPTPTP